MQGTDPLIRTKLRPPFIRPSRVARPHLAARLAEGLRGPLSLIVAPAGFGKTTLAAEALAAAGLPAAWLSLDAGDNQPGRLLVYLIAALQAVDPGMGREADQLLSGLQPAPEEAVLGSLINDLEEGSGDLALVLDDLQFLTHPAAYRPVAFLVEHCPRRLHLLVASRSDPALPLARLRARGQLVELRAADLRFSREEAGAFLTGVMGLQLDGGSVALLEARTEGWVAGLQMAALSLREREDVAGFIQGFSGTHRHILDYLLEEILSAQPEQVQAFLLETALPERLCGGLCEALVGGEVGSGQAMLEYLDHNNLFVVGLDEERGWFRYHHLFADLLRARLAQAHPERVGELHRRAAGWFEGQGWIAEAVQQRVAGGEVESAARLIERYGPARWVVSDPSIIQMADSLPPDLLANYPKLNLYRSWLLISRGSIEKALPLLKNLEEQLAGADPASGQHWMSMLVGLALSFLASSPVAPEADPLPDPRALEEIPADEPILRDAADNFYGMTLSRRGDIDRAADFSARCIQKKRVSQGSLEDIALTPLLASLYLFQGRLHAAAALCREFLASVHLKGIRVSTACNMEVVLGDVLYEWNCLEEAEKTLRDGIRANEPWGNIMADGFGLLALTFVLQAKGDFQGAMQAVDQFEQRMGGQFRPVEMRGPFRTLRVRVQLASGDLPGAADWADRIERSEDFQLHRDDYRITLASIRLAQGRYAEVEKILSGTPAVPVAGNRIAWQIESHLLLAAAIAGQGRQTEAFGIVESCLVLAEPEGYIQVFLNAGGPARELLVALLRSGASGHGAFARKLLEAFLPPGEADSPASQPAGLVEPLSEREVEVLRLIATGKTNQEIAHQLVVARGTIKAHSASIFRKLDVSNRTEAVARARQLGILP